MKKNIISIVLILSMLISFGLSTSATAAIETSMYDEYGEVVHHAMNVHIPVGSFHNTFASTNQPYTSYFYVLTTPYYYDQDFYSSKLRATSLFETYYYNNGVEVTITDDVYAEGNDGSSALVEGYDYDTAYLQLSQVGVEEFYYRIVNTVYSTATTEYSGVYMVEDTFCFDNNGVSVD